MRTDTEEALWASLPEELAKKIANHAFDAWAGRHRTYATLERDGWAMAHLNRAFFDAFLPMRLMLRHGPKHPHRAFCLVEGVLRFLHSRPVVPIPTSIYCLMYCEAYRSCEGCECGLEDVTNRTIGNYKQAWKTIRKRCTQKNMLHALTYWLIHLYTSGELPKPTPSERKRILHVLGAVFHYVERYHVKHLNLPSVRQHVEQAYAVVDALC